MNIQECDILNTLFSTEYSNQRELSEISGHSLGIVNRSINALKEHGYLDQNNKLTVKAIDKISKNSPRNAVILAAGYGMRMVPINTETPKGLIEVHKEPLIERLIKQLHSVGITEIYVIVGFMKEQYEYLIDKYEVELIVNTDYSTKNNLHSLKLAADYLGNTYIIPCDLWCKTNPFHHHELYSWYMISDALTHESNIKINRKMDLVSTSENEKGNIMLGISYITKDDAEKLRKQITNLSSDSRYDNAFWEEALYKKNKMYIPGKIAHYTDIIEINTYEQLRELDNNSNQLKSDAIEIAAKALNISAPDITNITILKKGMTNRSFLFKSLGQKYIMRIPGEGTDQLINRENEAKVYQTIQGENICDDIIYINPKNGYKITKFMENTRVCDPNSLTDVKKCMTKLRLFHEKKLKVNHRFDLFDQIDFYEKLWNGKKSVYKDYQQTKLNILSLKPYISKHVNEEVLTHIDAVPDNFLFTTFNDQEKIYLIDWEYAGMQDPHVDIAMFCIYSFYDKQQIDQTIDYYFNNNCSDSIRTKIYCYVAVCGLLWSNWCEYKRTLGVDFGEYSLKQYRYAKEYYRIAQSIIKETE